MCMSPVVKSLSMLTWVMAIGKDLSAISAQRTDGSSEAVNKLHKHGQAVHDAAREALMVTTARKNLKKNLLLKISKNIQDLDKIGHVSGTQKRLEVICAVMLAGTEDILSHIKDRKRKKLVEKLVDKIVAMNKLVDPDGDQTAHYIRADYAYQRWAKG